MSKVIQLPNIEARMKEVRRKTDRHIDDKDPALRTLCGTTLVRLAGWTPPLMKIWFTKNMMPETA